MIKQFIDILERMRHLNKDQKEVFYAFVFEDKEDISILSSNERQELWKFVEMCWDHIRNIYPKDATDSMTPHTSDQLYELYCLLHQEILPSTIENG